MAPCAATRATRRAHGEREGHPAAVEQNGLCCRSCTRRRRVVHSVAPRAATRAHRRRLLVLQSIAPRAATWAHQWRLVPPLARTARGTDDLMERSGSYTELDTCWKPSSLGPPRLVPGTTPNNLKVAMFVPTPLCYGRFSPGLRYRRRRAFCDGAPRRFMRKELRLAEPHLSSLDRGVEIP